MHYGLDYYTDIPPQLTYSVIILINELKQCWIIKINDICQNSITKLNNIYIQHQIYVSAQTFHLHLLR